MSFIKVIKDVRSNTQMFDQWEEANDQEDLKRKKYFEKQHLDPQTLERARIKGERLIDTISIMDEKSEDVAEDIEAATEQGIGLTSAAGAGLGLFLGNLMSQSHVKKLQKSIDKKAIKKAAVSVGAKVAGMSMLGGLGAFIAASLYFTNLQIKGSKVARYQARKDLKTSDFVEYTSEQTAEAKKLSKDIKIKDKSDRKGPIKYIKELMSVVQDSKKASEEFKDSNKFALPENLTKEERINLKKDQRVLNRLIKKINNTAEEYSENMETTAGVIIGSSFIGGAILGRFAKGMGKVLGRVFKKPAIEAALSNTGARTGLGALLVGLIGTIASLGMQKDAARAGRYAAKRDLVADATNFVDVDDKDLKSIADEHIEKKGLFKKMTEVFTTIPQTVRDYLDYKKYKKTELIENKKLIKALEKTKVSDDQLRKAEILKSRVFKSFDVVDNYSQEYSEQMEAASEIGMQLVSTLGQAAMFLPAILIAMKKPSVQTIVEKIVNKVAKNPDSKSLKRTVKKMPENIAKALSSKKVKGHVGVFIQKNEETFKKIFKGEEISDNEALDLVHKLRTSYEGRRVMDKLFTKVKSHSILNEMPDEFFVFMLKKLNPDKLLNQMVSTDKLTSELAKVKNKLAEFETDADLMKYIENNPLLSSICKKKTTKEEVTKLLENTEKIVESIKPEDKEKILGSLREGLKNNPAKTLDILTGPKVTRIGFFLKTTDLTTKAAVAYGSYIALNIAGIMGINSYLANMQKNAGRLGVMNALEELNKETDNMNVNIEGDDAKTKNSFASTKVIHETAVLPQQPIQEQPNVSFNKLMSMQDFLNKTKAVQ